MVLALDHDRVPTSPIHVMSVTRRLAGHGDDDPPDLLATEQAQAIAGLSARNRPLIPRLTGRRAAFLHGDSLHADRLVDEADREGAGPSSRSPPAEA